MNAGTTLRHALLTHVIQQRTPQFCLPATGRGQWLYFASDVAQLMPTFGPVFKPVGPVHLILVEQIRQTFGQLIAFAQVGVVGKEALQRFEMRSIDDLREAGA